MEGKKYDLGKLRMDLIPPEAMVALSKVLTYGAAKYTERNWELGMEWGRIFGAVQRHLWAFWQGEDTDPESGLPHIYHALCGLAFLTTYYDRQAGSDDRSIHPKREGNDP